MHAQGGGVAVDALRFEILFAANFKTRLEQRGDGVRNNPNYIAETIQPNIGIPSMLGVKRGNESRQQIESKFISTLQAAGLEATLVDATSLSHEEVNNQIGDAGDTIMTEPLIRFLKGCFDQ